ncbi:ATP-binding cassette domain-containing protein [Actinokineospora sp.]|uniref:ATP-binding cassette domain-containing protein n=1 Tax=Actinokineospora sp. TaxID=1872133 RepID=UPI00403810C3
MDRLTLHIAEGERVALLGPSGAGKSTLLRALLGAVPIRGEVRVGALDPYRSERNARTVRAATGFVRQGNDLVLGLSARLNAIMGTSATWRWRDWPRALAGGTPPSLARRLDTLALSHGIADCLSQPARTLSGGQRQRVALVRALLGAPRLLLADEPTSGLDPVTAAAAVDALRDADDRDRPVTVVVATHDLAVARRFPRIVALRDGRLVYDGPVLDDPTAALIYGSQG